jgi:FkbM family methyltransferase
MTLRLSSRDTKSLRLQALRALIRATNATASCSSPAHKLVYNMSTLALERAVGQVEFTEDHGNTFLLYPHHVVDRYLILDGVWESHVTRAMERHLAEGDVFYDIGSNIGYNTLLAARLLGATGRVVSFEPNPEVAARLRGNLARNGVDNVDVVEACVTSSGADRLQLNLPPASVPNPGRATTLATEGFEAVECAAVRVDSLVQEGRIPPPTVVKVDVEGAELDVLGSLEAQLAPSDRKLVVMLEITRREGEESEVERWLRERGFNIEEVSKPYHCVRDGDAFIQQDAVFVKVPPRTPRDAD